MDESGINVGLGFDWHWGCGESVDCGHGRGRDSCYGCDSGFGGRDADLKMTLSRALAERVAMANASMIGSATASDALVASSSGDLGTGCDLIRSMKTMIVNEISSWMQSVTHVYLGIHLDQALLSHHLRPSLLETLGFPSPHQQVLVPRASPPPSRHLVALAVVQLLVLEGVAPSGSSCELGLD